MTMRTFRQKALRVVPAGLALLSVIGLDGIAPAAAQEEKTIEERTRGETRVTPAMREAVYKKLSEAQTLAENKQYKEALGKLNDLRNMKDLNSYEKAQMYSFTAYVQFSQDNYKEAIKNYEQVLAQPDIPLAMEDQTIYTLAQLYFQDEQYRKSIQMMERWLKTADKPGPEPYMVIGQAYYQLNEYKKALVPVEKGIAIAREQGKEVKENWLLLLRLFYYELKDYPKVVKILEELVTRFPKREYWVQLSAMYGEMNKDREQLAAYRIAYRQGYLSRGPEYLQLASLSLQAEVPWEAAQVLEEGFKKGLVEKNAQNYRMLANAYTLAQEDQKALEPLTQAARLSGDGELDIRLGQAYYNLDQYEKAVESLRKGLQKGNIKRVDDAYIVLGMALFELKQFDAAKSAFRNARSDARSSKAANQWLQYIESEEERQDQLREALRGQG